MGRDPTRRRVGKFEPTLFDVSRLSRLLLIFASNLVRGMVLANINDATSVRLQIDINITFQSILKPNAYIVTQGPTENTVTEFWRMVWQEQASCIVMLTKTFDFIKVKVTRARKSEPSRIGNKKD